MWLERQYRQRMISSGFAVPHDMKNDILKCRVLIVVVREPAVGSEVDFHIAILGQRIAELDDGLAKIRPRLMVPETGMQDPNWLGVNAVEIRPAEALVLPDELEELLGDRGAVGPFGQGMGHPTAGPP